MKTLYRACILACALAMSAMSAAVAASPGIDSPVVAAYTATQTREAVMAPVAAKAITQAPAAKAAEASRTWASLARPAAGLTIAFVGIVLAIRTRAESADSIRHRFNAHV